MKIILVLTLLIGINIRSFCQSDSVFKDIKSARLNPLKVKELQLSNFNKQSIDLSEFNNICSFDLSNSKAKNIYIRCNSKNSMEVSLTNNLHLKNFIFNTPYLKCLVIKNCNKIQINQQTLKPKSQMELLEIIDSKKFTISIQKNISIRKVRIYRCSLRMVPIFISKVENLEDLILGNNQIEVIPSFITKLSSLKELSFCMNKLGMGKDVFPKNFFSLKKINLLVLSYNYINKVPLDSTFAFSQLVEVISKGNPFFKNGVVEKFPWSNTNFSRRGPHDIYCNGTKY